MFVDSLMAHREPCNDHLGKLSGCTSRSRQISHVFSAVCGGGGRCVWWWSRDLPQFSGGSGGGAMLPVGVTATPSGCATTSWKCNSNLRISTLIIRSIVSSCNVCFAKQRKKCRPIHSLPLPYIWELHCNPAHTYLYCIDTLINSILFYWLVLHWWCLVSLMRLGHNVFVWRWLAATHTIASFYGYFYWYNVNRGLYPNTMLSYVMLGVV